MFVWIFYLIFCFFLGHVLALVYVTGHHVFVPSAEADRDQVIRIKDDTVKTTASRRRPLMNCDVSEVTYDSVFVTAIKPVTVSCWVGIGASVRFTSILRTYS